MYNRHVIEQYFAGLEKCLEKHDLMDKPGQIHNLKLVYLWITDYIPKKKKEGGKEISKK